MDTSPIQYVDIALDTIWVDSVTGPHPHDHIILIYLKAVVSNRSNDTVQSYTMHHEEVFEHFCFDGVNLHAYEHQKIETNKSDTIRFQLWTYRAMYFQRRVYVHHANHHLDTLLFNNSFLVNHFLSSSDDLTGKQIVIYPNPFTNQTVLQTYKVLTNATLALYNSLGQQVKQLNNINGQTVTLNRDNLPSGLYYLQLTQDNQTIATDKIVIAD